MSFSAKGVGKEGYEKGVEEVEDEVHVFLSYVLFRA